MDAFRAKCLTYNQDDMLDIEHENATVIYSQTSGRERELSRFRAVKLVEGHLNGAEDAILQRRQVEQRDDIDDRARQYDMETKW